MKANTLPEGVNTILERERKSMLLTQFSVSFDVEGVE